MLNPSDLTLKHIVDNSPAGHDAFMRYGAENLVYCRNVKNATGDGVVAVIFSASGAAMSTAKSIEEAQVIARQYDLEPMLVD